MQVLAFTLNYPPARFIGSEVMTHRLLVSLRERGHDVTALVSEAEADAAWEYEGITVRHRFAERPRADLVICHADFANRAAFVARRDRARLVGICHNAEGPVRRGLERIPFDAVVVNSESMREQLGIEGAIVVHPPLRDHRQPRREQDRPLLAARTSAA